MKDALGVSKLVRLATHSAFLIAVTQEGSATRRVPVSNAKAGVEGASRGVLVVDSQKVGA